MPSVSCSRLSTYFTPLLSVSSISGTFWFKTIFFSSFFYCDFVLRYFLSSLNCTLVSGVISIFTLSTLNHCWGCHWIISVHPAKTGNFKMFFCADFHFSLSFLFPVINWFWSFLKYNTRTTHLDLFQPKTGCLLSFSGM